MRHNHPHGPVHSIHSHQHHIGWNNAFPPVAKAAPGDVLEFDCLDPSCGQITPDWKAADLARLDFGRINPTLGPIEIDGAEPGDALRITFLGFQNCGWGWTANIPGFGLLADQFKEPALHIWKYDSSLSQPAMFGGLAAVPLKPFCGTIGVAPAEAGLHSVVPPRQVGGNMDIRDLSIGTELFLPIEVKGALFSIGDPHAAQGDGEVCGTAIESQHKVTLEARPCERRQPQDAALPHAGPGVAPSRREGLRRDDGHRPRPVHRRAQCRQRHDRPAHQAPQHVGDRSLHAVLGLRRPQDQRDRRHAELGGEPVLPAGGAGLSRAHAPPLSAPRP